MLRDLAEEDRGLVLVTGVTGSGKSSTLAAMLSHINKTRPAKVVTIEDPIEFLYKDDRAIVIQRELGGDTDSFARALRAALRQDPDIIMVGEMRDMETIDIALKAAETGHLVFSTVHTTRRDQDDLPPGERLRAGGAAGRPPAARRDAARRDLAAPPPPQGRTGTRGGRGDHAEHAGRSRSSSPTRPARARSRT